MHAIKAAFRILLMIAIPMILGNSIYYIIGSFIALDFNPLNWWIFEETMGRILIIILEIILLVHIPEFWENTDFDI